MMNVNTGSLPLKGYNKLLNIDKDYISPPHASIVLICLLKNCSSRTMRYHLFV